MKSVVTLVLLANERGARVLRNEGVGAGLHQVGHLDIDQAERKIDHDDTPGRSRAAPGMARHGFAGSEAEARQTRDAFADRIVDWLSGLARHQAPDRLIVSAPPKMLGSLRDRMPPALRKAVTGELDKDLMHTPLDALPGHFADLAAF